jgi:uncharacterized membrane protein YraQ (UPF0718 family)
MKPAEKSMAGWWFLGIAVLICAAAFLFRRDAIAPSLSFFWGVIKKIIPVFVLIFALLVIMNMLVKPKSIVKHLGKGSGVKGWAFAVVGGILSTGPIYMWYPLLNEMQKHGTRPAYLAAFLYNRALKPALLPLFIYYFGLAYVIVLSSVMLVASVFQGIIVEKIVEAKK